jgi:hypothetical protein
MTTGRFSRRSRSARRTRPGFRCRCSWTGTRSATGPSSTPWRGRGSARRGLARPGPRARSSTAQAIDYALNVVFDYAARHAEEPSLDLRGRRPPGGGVRGALDDRPDVPVHVIGPPALVDRAAAWGWARGLLPEDGAEVLSDGPDARHADRGLYVGPDPSDGQLMARWGSVPSAGWSGPPAARLSASRLLALLWRSRRRPGRPRQACRSPSGRWLAAAFVALTLADRAVGPPLATDGPAASASHSARVMRCGNTTLPRS